MDTRFFDKKNELQFSFLIVIVFSHLPIIPQKKQEKSLDLSHHLYICMLLMVSAWRRSSSEFKSLIVEVSGFSRRFPGKNPDWKKSMEIFRTLECKREIFEVKELKEQKKQIVLKGGEIWALWLNSVLMPQLR